MKDVRIDKWLWAARCFKTRTKATQACEGGAVTVNDVRSKAARRVGPGDVVRVDTPAGLRVLEIVALAERRGSASLAQGLYLDRTPATPEQPLAPCERAQGEGRPTKRERRIQARFTGRE